MESRLIGRVQQELETHHTLALQGQSAESA
jgi:hypothetical protein